MKDNELLQFLYKTAEMGIQGLQDVKPQIEEDALRSAVERQMAEYVGIAKTSGDMLKRQGLDPKGPGLGARISSEVMSTAKTIADPSASNIAEMVIQGSTMGVTKCTKHLNDYSGNDRGVRSLAEKLIKTEQANIEQMKLWL